MKTILSSGQQIKKPNFRPSKQIGKANITIVGCGGAGNNTVDRLMKIGIRGSHCVAINTDQQHLESIHADEKLLIGPETTRGLGAGGLPEIGATGGRGHKGNIYEGGIRVPAILEWPAHIKKPRISNIPCNTYDIYPTLLEIAQIQLESQPSLDGISLVPLIMDKMKNRPTPMGFWQYPGGIGIPSSKWMSELLYEQEKDLPPRDSSRLRLDAGNIDHKYSVEFFEGHAAWLEWPWKLHRIQKDSFDVKVELYNLVEDPLEKRDLAAQDTVRTNSMRYQIEAWQTSVVHSLNGNDYR